MTHEEVGIGGDHTVTHGRTFDLEIILGVKEVVVFESKLSELDKELS